MIVRFDTIMYLISVVCYDKKNIYTLILKEFHYTSFKFEENILIIK